MDEASESKQGETALDGLAAEQMWMRQREMDREREWERQRWRGKRGSIFIDLLVT